MQEGCDSPAASVIMIHLRRAGGRSEVGASEGVRGVGNKRSNRYCEMMANCAIMAGRVGSCGRWKAFLFTSQFLFSCTLAPRSGDRLHQISVNLTLQGWWIEL